MGDIMEKSVILYHGSENIIEKPRYGYGKVYNDYGLGFYCTEYIELAKEWACGNQTDGYANKYELDLNGLKILNLNDKDYSIIHWISILLENRKFDIKTPIAKSAKEYLLNNFYINVEDYDVIIGYRADDSYFSFAKDFLNGAMSVRVLKRVMKLGNLGNQVVLISEKAFNQIKYLGNEIAEKDIYLPLRIKRDVLAKYEYLNCKDNEYDKNDIFVLDIIRGGLKPNDPRLQ